jgi:hypothetical protein
MRSTLALYALALVLAVSSAHAAEIALYQIPTDQLCTRAPNGGWYLDSNKLLAELVGRMVRAGKVPIDTGDDSGRVSLSFSRAEIADVLSDDLADFYGHLTNTDYRLVSYRHPTAAEIRQHPELGRRGGFLLFPTGRFAVVQCLAPEEEAVADKNARPLPEVVFRLRGDPTDLPNPLDDGSKPATFSITDDFKESVTSFQINGALGVGVSGPLVTERSTLGGYDVVADGQLILYGRLNQKGADNKESLEIDNKAAGLLGEIDWGRIGGWENHLSLLAAYTWDEVVDSEIETARAVWRPLPGWKAHTKAGNWWLKSFRNYANFKLGGMVFEVRNKLTGEAVYGNAVEAGTDPLFQEDRTYFQAGGVIGTSISWVDMNLLRLGRSEGILRGMTLFAQYKWLGGITGTLDDFERFEGGVTFAFGESNKFGWTTKYVNGRLDDTLQEVDFIESAFSMKF